MELTTLAERIGATILTGPPPGRVEIRGVYAGDRISDLLNQGNADTLLVTNLTGIQVLRVTELMDVPALCLLDGAAPEPELIRAAQQHDTVLLLSPLGMFETCGRLYACLGAASEARV